jgi:hypothetical protein
MLSSLFGPGTVDAAVGSIQKTIDRLLAIRTRELEAANSLRSMADTYLDQADKAEVEASRATKIVRDLGTLIGSKD